MAVFRWWLANAGTCGVLASFVIPVLASNGQTLAAWLLGLLVLVSLAQGLRNLWALSRWKAVTLAAVIPALLTASLLTEQRADASLLFFFAPGALAAVAEALVRRWRIAHGLAATPPPALPPAARPRPPLRSRVATGCAVLLGLGVGVVALTAWSIRTPARNARAFADALRPRMALTDVAIAAWPHGRYLVFVRAPAEAPSLALAAGSARVGQERAEGEPAVRALLDRHAPMLHVESVSFMFLAVMPVRSTVVVRFGPDGRVTAVEGPFHRAD